MTRFLIVNADDFGLTPGVCQGILRAGDVGIVTSTSVLAAGTSSTAWSPSLRDSGLSVGAHLSAVGEDAPLLRASEVPSLVDRRGRLRPSWRTFALDWVLGRIDPADLEREFGAQLESIQSSGLAVSHLDTHQNVHLLPGVHRLLIRLAGRWEIPAMRVPRSRRLDPLHLGVRRLAASLEVAARREGLHVTEASAGLDEAGRLEGDRLRRTLDALLAGGARTMELATHPGASPDPDRIRYRWGYRWDEELEALCEPSLRAKVDDLGIVLIGYDRLPEVDGS